MTLYKAPLRDIRFLTDEVFRFDAHFSKLSGCEEVNQTLLSAIFGEIARFSEKVLLPLNQSGDQQGCRWEDGKVATPTGFAAAYREFVAGGWPGLIRSEQFGGQGLPPSVELVTSEIVSGANAAWSMYPGLCRGAMDTIDTHGTDEQKKLFLGKLVSGQWTATMCLTEPHCGTDLGLLRTRAAPHADGSYRITGSKIFISAGEHDLSENIVHIVLARLPDAPPGSAGISLFIVPKFNLGQDAQPGDRNAVSCGSIENKMGLKGSATCVLNFEGATGYLIGPANKGLNCMFVFMNGARIGVGTQGVVHAEIAFQNALAYARDRLQMRSLSGVKAPDQYADPIIVHPDVRRMLLTQKAIAEGGRALVLYAGQFLDIVARSPEAGRRHDADARLAFLTPIIKACLSELGFEAANLGLQCFGGHGYIREWGMEQNVRDCRISTLYEGTTGIQALDLLGRKVLRDKGSAMACFIEEIRAFCDSQAALPAMGQFIMPLQHLIGEWQALVVDIGNAAALDPEEVGAASVDFLMYSGYVTLAYMWARMAGVASKQVARQDAGSGFYRSKLVTARFYFERILPRTNTLKQTMLAGAGTLMGLAADEFCPET